MKKNIFKFNKARRVIIFFCITLLIISLYYLSRYTAWRTCGSSSDFDTYYHAAKDVFFGSRIYADYEETVSPYIYPPFFACLIAPLTIFNLKTASIIWYYLNLGFFFLSLLLCFRLIFDKANMNTIHRLFPLIPKILFLIVTIALFLDNIIMLQANILIFSAVLLGLYLFKKNKDILAGLFLAMAISIKIFPILFLIYFFIKREFKICVSIVLWILIFTLVIPSFYMGLDDAWHSLILWNKKVFVRLISAVPTFEMIIYMFNPENQSVTAFFSKWLIRNDLLILHFKRMAHEYYPFLINLTFSLKKEYALYVCKIIIFLLLTVTLLYCFRKTKNRANPLLNYEYSLIFLLSLILSPVLRTQQMIFIIFPSLLLLSNVTKSNRGYRFFYWAFICFSFLYLSQASTICKIFGFGTLSILLLWSLVIMRYRNKLNYIITINSDN